MNTRTAPTLFAALVVLASYALGPRALAIDAAAAVAVPATTTSSQAAAAVGSEASSAAVTEQAQPTAPPKPKYATARVTLQTAMGAIVLEVETQRAPITSANFLRYVKEKRFIGSNFYRAMKVAPGYGLIQGGTTSNPKRALPPIKHEPTTLTGLSHTDGAISMARSNPGTAAGDFFIIVGDLVSLDADPSKPGDNAGYAVFGHVVEGMDVVHKILEAPTSTTLGEGVMRGQMLAAPVKITGATRMP